MALDEREQLILDAVESALCTEDPRLAALFAPEHSPGCDCPSRPPHRAWGRRWWPSRRHDRGEDGCAHRGEDGPEDSLPV
jgi:hypothetical protein